MIKPCAMVTHILFRNQFVLELEISKQHGNSYCMRYCEPRFRAQALCNGLFLWISLVPRPHHVHEERIWGQDIEAFSYSCAPSCDCMCSNTNNNHMIAELAKPRFGANVPKPFPCMHGGIWECDYLWMSSKEIVIPGHN